MPLIGQNNFTLKTSTWGKLVSGSTEQVYSVQASSLILYRVQSQSSCELYICTFIQCRLGLSMAVNEGLHKD